MLVSFLSADLKTAQESAKKLFESKKGAKDGLYSLSLNSETFKEQALDELLNSSALFQSEYLVFLNNILEDPEAKDIFFDNIEAFEKAPHLFILATGNLDRDSLSKVKKHSFKYQELSSPSEDFTQKGNINFKLLDAILDFDKKRAWLLLLQSLEESEPELLYGSLAWMFKNIKLSAVQSGKLKPFIKRKYENFLKKADKKKLEQAYRDFLLLPTVSRKRSVKLDLLMEKWILTLNIKK